MPCERCNDNCEVEINGAVDACPDCYEDDKFLPGWKRRKNQTISKPSMEKPLPTKERKCLTCGTKFQSQGFHNRQCDHCRQISASPFEPNG